MPMCGIRCQRAIEIVSFHLIEKDFNPISDLSLPAYRTSLAHFTHARTPHTRSAHGERSCTSEFRN